MADAPKVLIAEDDRMTQRILQATLTQHPQLKAHGFELVMTGDGQSAVEEFPVVRPRIVIVDLFMPRLDGFSVCRAIREHELGRTVPIIVTSAVWKQPEMLEQLKQDFDVTFVEKPFQVDQLVGAVQSAMLKEADGPPWRGHDGFDTLGASWRCVSPFATNLARIFGHTWSSTPPRGPSTCP